jgi:hypothetical protein
VDRYAIVGQRNYGPAETLVVTQSLSPVDIGTLVVLPVGVQARFFH